MAKIRYSKDQIPYWKESVHKVSYTRNGEKCLSTHYSVKILHDGCRRTINLGTANRDAAAEKARDLYRQIKADGWGDLNSLPQTVQATAQTIGDLMAAYRKADIVSSGTLHQYEHALKRIAGDIVGTKKNKNRYSREGSKALHEHLDSIPLASLTQESVLRWRSAYLKTAQTNEQKRSRSRTVNTYIRNARSLLSKKHLDLLKDLAGFSLSIPNPFSGISRLPEGSHRYVSTIDATALATAAEAELRTSEPEMFKIFVLSLIMGLRRNEVDKLRWDAFDFNKKVLQITVTDVFTGKTDSSVGELPLSDELVRLFSDYHKNRSSIYVIESDVDVREGTRYRHYRANFHENGLIAWLREKGITAQKPLHTLRKEMGRILAEKYGIYAASKRLRHADLSVTVRHYADDQRLLPTGLEGIVGGDVDSSA